MTLALIFETTLRTILVAALAGLGLAIFRVRSSTVKLAVWRLVLYASLLMPLVSFMPKRAIVVPHPPTQVVTAFRNASTRLAVLPVPAAPTSSDPIDWTAIALRAYALIAGLMLLRAILGLLKLRQLGMDATPMPDLGADVFESSKLTVPVTYGIFNPRILLPADWHNWSDETLDAVLAHERAHIAERDFLTQCLSKINRAVYWSNPLVWWLDNQLALLAEHSSDDAALSQVGERPAYAAMLLGFAERRSNLASAGVAMARSAGVAGRIDRILDEARLLSGPISGLARVTLAAGVFVAVVAIGACKMSTVSAQTVPQPPSPPSSPTAPVPPRASRSGSTHFSWSSDHDDSQWVLVTPHGTSMNGSSDFLARARSMKPQTRGEDYLIFIRDGKTYLLDDPKTIAEIEDWFKPMEELGRLQGELGEKQGVLGEEMGKLGEEMSKLGEQMSTIKVEVPDMKKIQAEIEALRSLQGGISGRGREISVDELSNLQSRLGDLQSLIGQAQSLAGDKQSRIGELQAKLGEQQARLGEKQGKLGEEQGRLGERQAKIAEEAERKLRRLFDQALQDGRAKPVR